MAGKAEKERKERREKREGNGKKGTSLFTKILDALLSVLEYAYWTH